MPTRPRPWSSPGYLPLADQGLVSRREALIHFRMLGNPVSSSSAAAENQRSSGYRETQREARHPTLHSVR